MTPAQRTEIATLGDKIDATVRDGVIACTRARIQQIGEAIPLAAQADIRGLYYERVRLLHQLAEMGVPYQL